MIDADGRAHLGVNVENAAYPSGTCAEQTAIGAMVTAGGRKIAKVLIAAGSDAVVQPCGACRQRIAEFAAETCEIVSVQGGKATRRTPFWGLLPDRSDPGTWTRGQEKGAARKPPLSLIVRPPP